MFVAGFRLSKSASTFSFLYLRLIAIFGIIN